MKKYLFLFFSVFAIIQSFAQTNRGVAPFGLDQQNSGNIKAVIIGVSAYKNINNLLYAHRDALSFYTFLKSINENIQDDDIQLLINDNATRVNAMSSIRYTINNSKEGDVIIVYFAGHGDVEPSAQNEGYLLLYDVRNEGDYSIIGGLRLGWLKRELMRGIDEGKKIIVITDACRAGKLLGNKGASKTLSVLVQEWNEIIKFVSCEPQQSSFEYDTLQGGHGVFTYYFLQGLSGKADSNKNNIIEAGELNIYLQKNVNTSTKQKQSPRLAGGRFNTKLLSANVLSEEQLTALFEPEQEGNFAFAGTKIKRGIQQKNSEPSEAEKLKSQFTGYIQKGFLIPKKDKQKKEFAQITIGDHVFLPVNTKNEKLVDASPKQKNVFATANVDKTIRLWTVFENNQVRPLSKSPSHQDKITGLQFSFDGNHLISSDNNGFLYFWNSQNISLIKKLKLFKVGVKSITSYKNGNYIACSVYGNKVYFYDTEKLITGDKTPVAVINSKYGTLDEIKISNSGKYLYGIAGRKVVSMAIGGKAKEKVFAGHQSGIVDIELSPDGKILYSADRNNKIIERNIQNDSIIKIYTNKTRINDIQLDIYGSFLYVAGMGRELSIIDTNKKTYTDKEISSPQSINDLAVNSQGNILFATTYAWKGNPSNTGFLKLNITQPKIDNAYSAFLEIKSLGLPKTYTGKLKIQLFAEMNEQIQKIVQPLVEGADIKPGIEEINHAIDITRYAAKLYPGEKLMTDDITAKKLFLEVNRTILENNLKAVDSALIKCDSIIALSPYSTYPYNSMADLYRKLNKLKQAKDKAEIAGKRIPSWTEPKANMGRTLLKEGNYNEAVLEFKKIIKLQPKISKGYTYLGIAYTKMNQLQEAETNFETAVKFDNKNPYIYNKYAELELKRRNFKKANTLLSKAEIHASEYYPTYNNLAQLYQEQGAYSKAESYYKTTIQKNASNSNAYIDFAEFEIERGRIKDAEKLFDLAFKTDSNNYRYYTGRAEYNMFLHTKLQSNDSLLSNANDLYDYALKIAPYQVSVYLDYADFLLKSLSDSSAHSFLGKTLRINEKDTVELKRKILQKVDKLITAAENIDPYRADVKLLKAKTLVLKEESASLLYEQLIEKYSFYPEIRFEYAVSAEKKGNTDKAEKLYEENIEMFGQHLNSYLGLLSVYKKQGKKRKFKKKSKEVIEIFPDAPKAHFIVAQSASLDEVNSLLRRAKNADNNYYKAFFAFGNYIYSVTSAARSNESVVYKDTQWDLKRVEVVNNKYIIVKRNNKFGLADIYGDIPVKADYETYTISKNNTIKFSDKDSEIVYTFSK